MHNLLIPNGNIRAWGTQGGSGIGAGCATQKGSSRVETLTILNGTIIATGSFGAGIGAGQAWDGPVVSWVTDLTIAGGNIEASGLRLSAGIGTGSALNQGSSGITRLTLENGSITAFGSDGAGIGAGYSDGKPSSIVNLTILDGRITAQSLAYGAGIGAGLGDGAGISNISVIRLVKGDIIAIGADASGIGNGNGGGGVKSVVFAGILSAQVNGSGRNAAVGAGSILLSDASLYLETGSLPAFSSGLSSAGVNDITVLYRAIAKSPSESLNNYAGQVIQFGEVVLPTSSKWVLCFSSGATKKYIDFDASQYKGLLVSVPSKGIYTVTASFGSV
jgi:hypothetical protein